MPNEFDWLDYKAKVAAIMLPHIPTSDESKQRQPIPTAIQPNV